MLTMARPKEWTRQLQKFNLHPTRTWQQPIHGRFVRPARDDVQASISPGLVNSDGVLYGGVSGGLNCLLWARFGRTPSAVTGSFPAKFRSDFPTYCVPINHNKSVTKPRRFLPRCHPLRRRLTGWRVGVDRAHCRRFHFTQIGLSH